MAVAARRVLLGAAAVILAARLTATTEAAEIKTLSTIGVQSAVDDLVPKFEKASGHKVTVVFGLSGPLSKRVAEGELLDVFIGTRENVNDLIKTGKIAAGSDTTFASSGVGIAVRAGAPKPDISTPEGLKRALLAARTVGYGNPAAGGAAGVHFGKVLERLGIAEQIKAKAKHPVPGTLTGSMLTSGEVEIAVQQIPELLAVKGIELVGPLPGDLQGTTVFAAGVAASSKEANAARGLVAFLHSPEAMAITKATGLDLR